MWTPKRILMLVAGFALFLSAYLVYAHFLGGIDGLPPLPGEYGPIAGNLDEPIEPPPERVNEADRRLRQAFGDDCPESKRTFKLETRAKGLVLAFDRIQIEPDGSVQLTPFSHALFGNKEEGAEKVPEITTVRSDIAILKFDRPIVSIAEMGDRRIVAAELRHEPNKRREEDGQGGVTIVNNQRTWARDDDISVFTPGPVYYDEAQHKIWTGQVVRLTDLRSKPKPTSVTAVGMDLHLTNESSPAAAASAGTRKPKSNGPSGVELIRLRAHVSMTLWVDARSGFLGGNRSEARGTAQARTPDTATQLAGPAQVPGDRSAPGAAAERAQVVINTQGPFTYNLSSALATFEISRQPSKYANHVEVNRLNDLEGKREQLVCEQLLLQFTRPTGNDPPRERGDRQPPDIESAHATGNHVTLFSDAQNLHALGTDLFYNGRTKETILKGVPEMHAAKDGNEIRASELRLRTDANGQLQQARARGPGRIELLNRSNGTRPLEASWKDELVSSKEGTQDVLTLIGDATFEDKEHGQRIQANRLQVWLEPVERGRAPGTDSARPVPQRLEAFERVAATSPEMHIHDTDRLIVWFRDASPPPGQLPETLPTALAPGERAAVVSRSLGGAGSATESPATPVAPPASPEAARPRQPIDLSARTVEAHVLRSGTKSELEKLWCEGVVRVRQEPATPEDRGVDIRGETLRLYHRAAGNVLTVTGQQAQVQLNKLYIFGPEVNIDQTTNEAVVNGVGVMRMPSNTTFEGGKLAKETDLVVQWNQRMRFDGSLAVAEFHGNVQAEQENGRLLCQSLRATLDRPVSLREGQKKGESPAVRSLVCEKKVQVEELKQEGGRLVGYQRIDCPELAVDNEDRRVHAAGPGEVRLFQLGPKGEVFAPPPGAGGRQPVGARPAARLAGQPPPPEEEYKLTSVNYSGWMSANHNSRTAIFFDNVEVIHLPADNPHLALHRDRLPPEAFFMRCERLEVYSRPEGDGRTTQHMHASKKVFLQGPDFTGQAHVVKYDAAKGQLILEGEKGSLALLSQTKVPGADPTEFRARKITYNRLTKEIHVDETRGVTVPNLR